jgi:hypothetical protein
MNRKTHLKLVRVIRPSFHFGRLCLVIMHQHCQTTFLRHCIYKSCITMSILVSAAWWQLFSPLSGWRFSSATGGFQPHVQMLSGWVDSLCPKTIGKIQARISQRKATFGNPSETILPICLHQRHCWKNISRRKRYDPGRESGTCGVA